MTSSTSRESLGIQRVASMHLFVRDLERSRDHYVDRLDFAETAVSTREFEMEHRARASVVEAGGARFVLMEPLGSRGESFHWLRKHPEGVGRLVFKVDDAEHTFSILRSRGATATTGIERRRVEDGEVAWFDVATPIGDTLFRFIEHEGRTPMMPELARVDDPPTGKNRFGFGEVDHITSNFLTLPPVVMWMKEIMGLEPFWEVEFHTQDVKKGAFEGSGLRSVVMWDPGSGIKFANNEPAAPFFRNSQIYRFCEDHHGPGVQHVAISASDIVHAVQGLRERGVEFMKTPASYYDLLPKRLEAANIEKLDEDLETLKRLEILVDGSGPDRYLLQIFMREAAGMFADTQAGPMFIEVIQRKGDPGFGAGNFRALFESIERQQQLEPEV